MTSCLRSLFSSRPARNAWRGRTILNVERLDDRIVPAAVQTVWAPAGVNLLWSNAANWSLGLPDSSRVAAFNGTVAGDCTFDSTVQPANRVVAGITTKDSWGGTLSLIGGNALTVAPDSDHGDTTTGFKWDRGSISQTNLNDVLVISGGDATYNKWSGGQIGTGSNLSEIDINNYATLQVTADASVLGDNVVIGQDGLGGSTLELKDQNVSLDVRHDAGITVSVTSCSANQLLFDGDVTTAGRQLVGYPFFGPPEMVVPLAGSFRSSFGGCPCKPRSHSALNSIGVL